MTDRASKLLVVLLGAVLAALVVVGILFVRAERRMARIEEQLAKNGAAAPAPQQGERAQAPLRRWASEPDPAPAGASPPRRARRPDLLREPAQPKMPEARKFAEDNDLNELEWRTLIRLNGYWMETLAKAEKDGEDALPDKLDYVARQREIKLRGVLGSDEGVASYREFEGSLKESRVTYKARDGTVYGAVPFE